MKYSTLLAALTLGLSVGAHADTTNLIADGDFEAFASQVTAGSWTRLYNGTQFGAWTVAANNVDLLRNSGAINGTSLAINGNTSGEISQTFQAIQGNTYRLTFDQYVEGTSTAGIYASINAGGYYFDAVSTVTQRTVSWTSPRTGDVVLKFVGTGTSGLGAVVDNVSLTNVTAVPEPASYALALAGLGVVGFVARRRQPR